MAPPKKADSCPSWCEVHKDSAVGRRLPWHASQFVGVPVELGRRGRVTLLAYLRKPDGDPRTWIYVSDGGSTSLELPEEEWFALRDAISAMTGHGGSGREDPETLIRP